MTVLAAPVLAVAISAPAHAEYSNYCSDGHLPTGPNFETGKIGAGSFAFVGGQGITDTGKTYNNTFADLCYGAAIPSVNTPFGTYGGTVASGYFSTRANDPYAPECELQLVMRSDSDALVQTGNRSICGYDS